LDFSESGKPLRKIRKPFEKFGRNRIAVGEIGKPSRESRKPLKKAESRKIK
jgi:hypothetical protein